jgi:putative nucleotidyltransferase with HDIG domain
MKSSFKISQETLNRCQIFQLNEQQLKKYSVINLDSFHFLYEIPQLDFSIYFRVGITMIEYIKAGEKSRELLDQIWASLQKKHEYVDLRILRKDRIVFFHSIEKVRRKKLDILAEKMPDLDKKTIDIFANLTRASQLIVKGGIDSHVVSAVKASASFMVSNIFSSDSTIDTLSRMITCDPTLYDHSASVAMFASSIAKGMVSNPLSQRETELVAQAGLYHDIGKTCVPNFILNKPGKFTPEEFEIMKSHTTLGHEELAKISHQGGGIDHLCCRVALEHHEKFDGSGYPLGKKGRFESDEENGIHLFSRIVSIADVYSALLMKRVYKPAYSSQDAVKTMAETATRDFDPEIFSDFVRTVIKSLNLHEEKKHSKGRILVIDECGKIQEYKKPA